MEIWTSMTVIAILDMYVWTQNYKNQSEANSISILVYAFLIVSKACCSPWSSELDSHSLFDLEH